MDRFTNSIKFWIYCNIFKAEAAVKWLSGDMKLPSKQEMLEDLRMNTEEHWARGYSKWKTHYLIYFEENYLKQITKLCDITPIPDVLYKIALDSFDLFLNQPTTFRRFKYSVVDNNNFTRTKINDE